MIDLIKALILPSHLTAILMFLGACFVLTQRLRSKGLFMLVSGTAVYLVFSNGIVAASLIGPLEYKYPPLATQSQVSDPRTVVVLTSFASDDRTMPLTSRAGTSAVYRTLEVLHLYSTGRASHILVSGDATAANIMAELLVTAGVPGSIVSIDGAAADTYESARRAREEISSSRIFLVTSAGHMPRAINGFVQVGFDPVPAPTDHKMPRDVFAASPMPSAFHLQVSDLAVHEYAALLFYRISGRSERFW